MKYINYALNSYFSRLVNILTHFVRLKKTKGKDRRRYALKKNCFVIQRNCSHVSEKFNLPNEWKLV